MTVADEHVAQLRALLLDQLDEQQAISDFGDGLPECARDALVLFTALQPVIGITLKLSHGPPPGSDAKGDASWAAAVALARRDVLAQQAAGTDSRLADDTLQLLDRIDALIGEWPADSWNDAVRVSVRELVEARQRGALRGQELRARRQETDSKDRHTVDWLLRHPSDHWLRQAVHGVADADCIALIENLITQLQPSYDQMRGLDWSAEEAAAEVICEAEIAEVSPGRWKEPATAAVTATVKGSWSANQHISVRLVERDDAPFNGTLVSLLAGERWRLCAREFSDGTLLPLDGTRRCAEGRGPTSREG